MAILLFTDFGSSDIYVGQLKWVLSARAPAVPVIDLLHDAPSFNIAAGAHLVAALAGRMRAGDITVAVVDPGVGGTRDAIAACTGGCWFVAPDNGLISVALARAEAAELFSIMWRPDSLGVSFHGRDLFAPVAAMLACGDRAGPRLVQKPALATDFGPKDLPEIIYIDHYGNAVTGLRASNVSRERRLTLGGGEVNYAPVFSAVPEGSGFWYENSLGLVEIAANMARASDRLGLRIGDKVLVGS